MVFLPGCQPAADRLCTGIVRAGGRCGAARAETAQSAHRVPAGERGRAHPEPAFRARRPGVRQHHQHRRAPSIPRLDSKVASPSLKNSLRYI